MLATIMTLVVVSLIVVFLVLRAKKEPRGPSKLPTAPPGGTTYQEPVENYSDGGSDPTRDPVTGEPKG
jgi:hypothetical protein